MKREAEIKELLINNAIHLIAEGGFEKATTKELAHSGGSLPDFKMNEVYIYRIFGSKENLFESVFDRLDHELLYAFQKGIEKVGGIDALNKETLYEFFLMAWRFILGNEERCRCYVRYYYSVYFKGNSLAAHRTLFGEMISVMAPLFREEADAASVLHSVFVAMLDFAIRVYNGDLEDNEVNRSLVCNVLYCMLMTYFKDPSGAD